LLSFFSNQENFFFQLQAVEELRRKCDQLHAHLLDIELAHAHQIQIRAINAEQVPAEIEQAKVIEICLS